ncbi:MAG: tRNA guanosine(34) transglycosylase Tgt [Acidobacteriota bacterium]
MSDALSFDVQARDPSGARAGRVTTRHGSFETPVFMPVGTQGTVKGLSSGDLEDLDAGIILGNAYHLWVRPGDERIERLGGLHRFMSWERSILTDSGGFQAMSLAHLRRLDEDGVRFRSHLDGTEMFMSPEESIRIQRRLGSDIMMVLDECPKLPATTEEIRSAVDRTTRWAERCVKERRESDGALFGIVQGGVDLDERQRSLDALVDLPFEGLALGGLSVGEGADDTWRMIAACAPELPEDRPRYLMGVGRPEDLVEAVFHGIDMFDCVYPTRNARNGTLLTSTGHLNIKRAEFTEDLGPIDESCGCRTCARYSRAYLRHLYLSREPLFNRLNTRHNVHQLLQLMRDLREAIVAGTLASFRDAFWAARGATSPSS